MEIVFPAPPRPILTYPDMSRFFLILFLSSCNRTIVERAKVGGGGFDALGTYSLGLDSKGGDKNRQKKKKTRFPISKDRRGSGPPRWAPAKWIWLTHSARGGHYPKDLGDVRQASPRSTEAEIARYTATKILKGAADNDDDSDSDSNDDNDVRTYTLHMAPVRAPVLQHRAH